ncbi:conjugative transfer ATPase [Endozoicomonas sp. ALC066]|uniref:conjugative transfer ATPase n=1 Tax=Endozoicomonas sp. ALC066 TaxID=3403078 RepID=UPI003BB7F97B
MFQSLLKAMGIADQEKSNPVTVSEMAKKYDRPRSFVDLMPWLEYLPESQSFLLEDGISVGAVYEITPVGTEGRSNEWLKHKRDAIEHALQDVFDEFEQGQWVIQQYAYDNNELYRFTDQLRDYVWPHAKGSEYSETYLNVMDQHLRGITREEGLFVDDGVSDAPWRGRVRHIKWVIYRRQPSGTKITESFSPETQLNETCSKLEQALKAVGINMSRCNGRDFYDWMLRWFNPRPGVTDGDREKFYNLANYPGDSDLPYGDDFAENLFYTPPESDAESQTWQFDGLKHRCIRVSKLRRAPKIGQLTGEVRNGEGDKAKSLCMLDKLPEGSVVCTTIVISPQDKIESQINHIHKKSIGETAESERTRKDCETAKHLIADGRKLFRSSMCIYVRAENLKELRKKSMQVSSLLLTNQLAPVEDDMEALGLDSYVINMPMNFQPELDKRYNTTRLIYAQHLANLCSLFGRNRGTGNPLQVYFNRGGELFTFDPLNKHDRKKNGHLVLFGPTGAGKSASLVATSCKLMGTIRPRLFIIEAGNSFGLMADYFERQGLTVNKVQLKPGSGVSLPPFADAHEILKQDSHRADETAGEGDVDVEDLQTNDDEGDDQRDVLGEMEIIALLMITGGEQREMDNLTRADRRRVREAIFTAAKKTYDEGRMTLTGDIVNALKEQSHDESIPQKYRERAFEMAEAMSIFCDGFEGELFNSPGEPWPEVDVTLIDLATFAREGYASQLAVAYTSIMMHVNNTAEKYQHEDRPLVMLTDEGHIITTNPLLAPFVVKIVKMWRKLGAWYWVATQNLEDFPDSARKMLNMIEWWVCLTMPLGEVEQMTRFKTLSDEQKFLLLSARKEPGKYVEGVVMSDMVEALFRNVPPSLYLSLAMTEKHEKAERAQLMKKHGISELDAAIMVAQKIDEKRGILEVASSQSSSTAKTKEVMA